MKSETLVTVAAVLGATGVAAGAFGAHAIADSLSPSRLETWETAARYQLIHAVALLALAASRGHVGGLWTGRLWTTGTLIFSGSLYALCLLDLSALGAIAPIGGLLLIAGWISLGVSSTVDGDRSELT